MANYYYITIKSDKMTQDIAAEIFSILVNKSRVRYFNYDENQLKYSIRGLVDIQKVIDKYNINKEEVMISNEFDF